MFVPTTARSRMPALPAERGATSIFCVGSQTYVFIIFIYSLVYPELTFQLLVVPFLLIL